MALASFHLWSSFKRRASHFFFLINLVFLANGAAAQSFVNATPPDLRFASYTGITKWGDMNNDGKLDLVYSGYFNNQIVLQVYSETNDAFTLAYSSSDIGASTQVTFNTVDLADFDNDGDLDILIANNKNWGTTYGNVETTVMRNDGGFTFSTTDVHLSLSGAVSWGDADRDGRPDILINQGLYYSTDLKFQKSITLSASYVSFQTWADLDADGDLDIIQSRRTSSSYGTFLGCFILSDKGDGSYVEKKIEQIQNDIYGAEFGDYDTDGDLDILIKTAFDQYDLYVNQNQNFTETSVSLPKAISAKWADFNNDGYSDILFTGGEEGYRNFVTRIYYSDTHGGFYNSGITELPAFERGSASVGDYDHDGDPDIALTGDNNAMVYKNNWIENGGTSNHAPSSPSLHTESITSSSVTFSWARSTDSETPYAALSYNLIVKKDDQLIVSPGVSSDTYLLYQNGNMYTALSYQVGCLEEGNFKWSVQSIDNSFSGSAFASERTFMISNIKPQSPTNLKATSLSDLSVKLNWTDNSTTESSYVIFRKEKADPNQLGYFQVAQIAANSTAFTDTLYLQPQTAYTYKVVAYNCSYPDQFYQEIDVNTFPKAFQRSNLFPFGDSKVSGRLALPADYDNDGDLDLLLSYYLENSYASKTLLYKYDEGIYKETANTFPAIDYYGSSAQWIDYNKDGYLDLLFIITQAFDYTIKLFLNDNEGSFVERPHSIRFDYSELAQSSLSFADFDNDTDLDLLAQGYDNSFSRSFKLLLNNGNNEFSNSGITLDSKLFIKSDNPWGDFNNDGYLDLLASREIDCGTYQTVILKNINGNHFEEINAHTSQGLNNDLLNMAGEAVWGDYDNDGYLDFIYSGQYKCGNGYGLTEIYHNNGNETFTKLATSLSSEIYDVNAQWGDFDNDGYYDLFLYGDPFVAGIDKTRIYKYDASLKTFRDTKLQDFPVSKQFGSTTIGDIDNDGDLDCIVLGEDDYVTPVIAVMKSNYSNAWNLINQKPSPPTNLRTSFEGGRLVLSWDKAFDTETNSSGLTYNIFLIQDRDTLIMPNSLHSGYRKLVQEGNVQHNTSISIGNLKYENYRWAVQSIDKSFVGSSFSDVQTFTITGLEKQSDLLECFPNPANDMLNIRVSRQSAIEIYSADGSLILSRNISANEIIPISNWSPGLYLIKANSGHQSITKKIIKK